MPGRPGGFQRPLQQRRKARGGPKVVQGGNTKEGPTQEVGDLAILLHAGYSRRRALGLNMLSGASGLLGALVAFAAFDLVPDVLSYFLSLAAASFLYIAMSDLIPNLHEGRIDANSFRQLLLVGAGVVTIVAL